LRHSPTGARLPLHRVLSRACAGIAADHIFPRCPGTHDNGYQALTCHPVAPPRMWQEVRQRGQAQVQGSPGESHVATRISSVRHSAAQSGVFSRGVIRFPTLWDSPKRTSQWPSHSLVLAIFCSVSWREQVVGSISTNVCQVRCRSGILKCSRS